MKKYYFFAVKLIITVLIFILLSKNIDWVSVGNVLINISIGAISLSIFIITFQNLLATFRWLVILKAVETIAENKHSFPFWEAVRYFMAGLFLNQVLPSTVGGDGLRVWFMHQRGTDVHHAMVSIVLERVLTLFGCLLLIFLTQPFYYLVPAENIMIWVFYLVFFGLAVGVAVVTIVGERICMISQWSFLMKITKLFTLLKQYFIVPSKLVAPIVLSIGGFILMTIVVYIYALALGINESIWIFFVLCPPVFLLSALPISISGWGVREGAMIVALGYLGVSPEKSLAISIALGITIIIGALPGSMFLLRGAKKAKPNVAIYDKRGNC